MYLQEESCFPFFAGSNKGTCLHVYVGIALAFSQTDILNLHPYHFLSFSLSLVFATEAECA